MEYAIVKYEVVYYTIEEGRMVWWPADGDVETVRKALEAARAAGKENARIALAA